jgi:hypothetical protein
MRILPILLLPLIFGGCPAKVSPSGPESAPSPTPAPTAPAAPAVPSPTPKPQIDHDFTGVWTTKDDQGDVFEMVIFPNGQAVTNWSKGLGGAKGERGFWREDGGRLIAIYEDGWTDVLEVSDDGFTHKGYSPETPLGDTPTNSAPAEKVSSPTASFVGVWRLNREPGGTYQYVALYANGRAFSTVNGGTEGSWEAAENGVKCTWPKDGWVDVIEHGPGGWQKRSWVGAESETLADISQVVRVGEEKFSITP